MTFFSTEVEAVMRPDFNFDVHAQVRLIKKSFSTGHFNLISDLLDVVISVRVP